MNRNEVEVLKGLKMMLKALFLFDTNGFKFGDIRIPNPLVVLSISSTLILHFGLTIWFCVEYEFDLKIISGAVSIASGSLQVQLIYIYLASYGRLVPDTVYDLQELVKQSKSNVLLSGRKKNKKFFIRHRMFQIGSINGDLPKEREFQSKICAKNFHFCFDCNRWILCYNRIDANFICFIRIPGSDGMDITITSGVRTLIPFIFLKINSKNCLDFQANIRYENVQRILCIMDPTDEC